MIKLFLALALLAAPPAPAPVSRPVRLVFIEPVGESFDHAAQVEARAQVKAAMDFWHDRSPVPVDLAVSSTELLTTTANVYGGDPTPWIGPYLHDGNSTITIFVVDNRESMRLLTSGSAGWAQDYYGVVVAVIRGLPGEDGLAATIAHELGHVMFGLPDRYRGNPACPIDIMCWPGPAYHSGTLGCDTLADLGAPCRRVYLPIVQAATR